MQDNVAVIGKQIGSQLVVRRAMALALALVVLIARSRFPVAVTPLACGIVAYFFVLLWRHEAWLPALLPVLDLAAWSGALFVDEFDLFVPSTVVVWLIKSPCERTVKRTF
ncbi:MAG: hypothetical protein ACI9DC_000252 [Gammaproteobacteria bacterium]|jgi:hypothetical protein